MPNRGSKIGMIFGAAAGLAGAGYYLLFRRPLPRKSGQMTMPGLQKPVKILRDEWGVPHIEAESLQDLVFAQGFVHAQDRLWQMEFNRRLVSGRLSGILGPVSLHLDRWIRTIGMRRTAEKEFSLLREETQQILGAYTAGVNARIQQGRLPVEFILLRFKPEPWTVTDTLAWPKMMGWTLSVNWEAEIIRAQIAAKIGMEALEELEMLSQPHPTTIISPGVDFAAIGEGALEKAKKARRFTGPSGSSGLGSNNWVLSGSRTKSGMPILANDMHLELTIPAIWYENHLKADGLNVTGVSIPGIPGVLAGHNEHVAWGFTNGFPDVQDLFIEHLQRVEDGKVQYEFKGKWLDAQVVNEVIQVKGQQPVTEEVVITHHGPIINALSPGLSGDQPLALSWVALEPSTILDALADLLTAQNCQQAIQALKNWDCPSQNTVFADTEGNIAYKLSGKVPVRKQGDGRLPVPGWTGEHEWESFIPFEEMPALYNPPEGYIVTANNRVVGENYPYHLSYDYCTDSRAARIVELIQENPKISPDDIRRMQFDQRSLPAIRLAKAIGELEVTDPVLRQVVAQMRTWDGVLASNSPEASIYEIFAQNSIRYLLKEKLGDLADHYAGKGPTPVLAGGSILAERSREWLDDLLRNPHSHWWDLGTGQNRQEILTSVLQETVDYLKQNLGPLMQDWQWGKLHALTFSHPLGSVKPLDKILNRGPYPLGGDFDTVWATGSSRYDLRARSTVGPPFRFIADLSDLSLSLGLLAPGQSGQPASPHYADNIQAWFHGVYHPMLFSQQQVEKAAKDTLLLVPPTSEPLPAVRNNTRSDSAS